MRRSDMVSGSIIIVVAAFFGIMSLRMPWHASEWGVYAAPGLVPLILSILLLSCGLVLILRAKLDKAHYDRMERLNAEVPTCGGEDESDAASTRSSDKSSLNEWRRILLTIGIAGAYVLVLGRIPYMLATGLFVLAFILAFRGGSVVKAAITAVATAILVWFVFAKIFLVTLP